MRTVLTSTRRLARIDERTDFATSPFLQGFIPPLYLTPLAADEARALLARGRFAADESSTHRSSAPACHPFLLQLIASRLFESRDLAATLDQVAADEMVANFFSVDFQTLDAERARRCSRRSRARARARRGELAQARRRARRRRSSRCSSACADGLPGGRRTARYRVGNWFFERWLRRVVAAAARGAHPSR